MKTKQRHQYEARAHRKTAAKAYTQRPIVPPRAPTETCCDRLSSATPVDVGLANIEGTAQSLSRADHIHRVPTATPVDVALANSEGNAGTFARSNHVHKVPTAVPVDVGTSNSEGNAGTFARSNHVHNHANQAGGALHAQVTQSVDGFMSAADKTRLDNITVLYAAVLYWGNGSVASTTATRYLAPGYDSGTAGTSSLQFHVPRAGIIRRMYVRHNVTAGNGNSIVYTLRVNGVATLLAVSLASTAAGGSDLVHNITVAQGDRVSIEVTKAAGVQTSPTDVMVSVEFAS